MGSGQVEEGQSGESIYLWGCYDLALLTHPSENHPKRAWAAAVSVITAASIYCAFTVGQALC